MLSIPLEAYFWEHSIYVTIVSIRCQMTEISAITAYSKIPRIADYASVCIPKTMSRTSNFETSYSCPILLEAYFSEHSVNVTIVLIGCQMAEISVKDGPIVIKKSYGDFCSYVVPSLIKFTWSSLRDPLRRGWVVWWCELRFTLIVLRFSLKRGHFEYKNVSYSQLLSKTWELTLTWVVGSTV